MPKQQPVKFKPKKLLGLMLSPVTAPLRKIDGFHAFVAGLVITVGGLFGGMITHMVQSSSFNNEIENATSLVFNEQSYQLTDDETVETIIDDTITEYNFAGDVRIVTVYENDVIDYRRQGYDNDVVSRNVVRFENLPNQAGHQDALQAAIQIATNLQTVFDDAGNRWLIGDEDETRARYEGFATEFLNAHANIEIAQADMNDTNSPTVETGQAEQTEQTGGAQPQP